MDIELALWWTSGFFKTLGLLTLFATVVGWVWYQWTNRRLISLANTLPTVDPVVLILGDLFDALKDPRKISKTFALEKVKRATDKGHEAFCVWIGPIPLVVVQKPEDVQLVFTRSSSLNKGFMHSMVEFVIGSGLLVGPVSRWRLIRRHFLPVFHGSNLEYVVPASNDRGRQILQILKERCSRGPVDILPLMRIPTFLNVCCLLFGDDSEKVIPNDPKVIQWIVNGIMRILELWSLRFHYPWLYSDWIFKFLYKKDVIEIEDVTSYCMKDILQLLRNKMSIKKYEKTTGNIGETGQCTIVDAFVSLTQADPSFNERDFHHEVITICGAGTNSAAVSLSSNMLALAWHPEVQERLYGEIVAVLGDDLMRDVTSEDLRNMPYLDQVLKESWRRYTVFPLNQRKTSEDLQLSFGVIPAGSHIQVAMFGVHMNPNIYPDPYKYDPERFSAENSTKRHKFSFVPFSGGPRGCIASAYATLFIKIAIVHVVREYTLHTNADPKEETFKFLIEAQRENGYPIWIEKRLN